MIAVNYSNFRNEMKKYFDKISENYETLIVTRKSNNMVIMSEETYNNLVENAYLMENKTNYDWLMESKKQMESNEVLSIDINEE